MSRLVLVLLVAGALTGCQGVYSRVREGSLTGKLTVEWYGPDRFVFRPHSSTPLTFVRAGGERIVPGEMYTDGGSVPRPLWVFRNYSPWGYAPAFIVHDWLFEMKHCGYAGNEKYDHHVAADVMAEVMKTMMLSGQVPVHEATVESMHAAVNSPIAAEHWQHGVCAPPDRIEAAEVPLATYELSFDP